MSSCCLSRVPCMFTLEDFRMFNDTKEFYACKNHLPSESLSFPAPIRRRRRSRHGFLRPLITRLLVLLLLMLDVLFSSAWCMLDEVEKRTVDELDEVPSDSKVNVEKMNTELCIYTKQKINDQCWRLTTQSTVERSEPCEVEMCAQRRGGSIVFGLFNFDSRVTLKKRESRAGNWTTFQSLKSRIFYFIT